MDEDRLPEDTMTVVFPYGVPIILVKKLEKIYAVSNKCAHMGCTLSRGSLVGLSVKCPCHEWMFDLKTGEFVTAGQIRIPAYESKVEEHKIYVKI
jgi:3-phenylpropionate/trans-cinnamate dioxygenase ferredoxin subunit